MLTEAPFNPGELRCEMIKKEFVDALVQFRLDWTECMGVWLDQVQGSPIHRSLPGKRP
jgi:hypothetical protein